MDKRNLIVMVKCEIGRTYDVAAEIADLPEGPIVYSTSGDYDLFTMFRLENNDDIGHYVCEIIQKIDGVRDTNTIVCFNPFTKDRGICGDDAVCNDPAPFIRASPGIRAALEGRLHPAVRAVQGT